MRRAVDKMCPLLDIDHLLLIVATSVIALLFTLLEMAGPDLDGIMDVRAAVLG